MGITRESHWEELLVDISVDDDRTNAFDSRPGAIYGLIVPAEFDGTAITFETSYDGETFAALYDTTNTAVGMTIAASRNYDLPTELAAWPFWRIVTTTVQDTTDTAFIVVAKG